MLCSCTRAKKRYAIVLYKGKTYRHTGLVLVVRLRHNTGRRMVLLWWPGDALQSSCFFVVRGEGAKNYLGLSSVLLIRIFGGHFYELYFDTVVKRFESHYRGH